MIDKWPESFEVNPEKSPYVIINTQASQLGLKTNQIVKAEVQQASRTSGKFEYAFYLVAPALDNYRFLLFYFIYSLEQWPVEIQLDSDIGDELNITGTASASNEEGLLDVLGKIFHSKKTTRIISVLLSESEGVSNPEWWISGEEE